MQRGAVRAVVALKVVALVWSSVVVAIDARSQVLTYPLAGMSVLAVLAVWTLAWGAGLWRSRPGRWVDAVLALAVLAGDEWVYTGAHPQSLGSIWPLAAVIGTGIVVGPWAGAVTGAVAGSVGIAAAAVVGRLEGNVLAGLGTTLLLTVAGWVAGSVTGRIVTDRATMSTLRAREELAAELHDGVLQTLAVIQRRSNDEDLVVMAREQDVALRALLARKEADDGSYGERPRVGVALSHAAARWQARFAVDVRVVVIDDGRTVADDEVVKAVGELVANVAKHSGVDQCVVSVDADGDQVVVCVHDEGSGFEPESVEGRGLRGSVRGRIESAGGTVEVRSAPGEGCDVTLRVPAGPTLPVRHRGPAR